MELFDEIARKNCRNINAHTVGVYGTGMCPNCAHSARLAQAAVEATREHMLADPEVTGCDDLPDSSFGPKCQSDIVRRTQEIYEKGGK